MYRGRTDVFVKMDLLEMEAHVQVSSSTVQLGYIEINLTMQNRNSA